MMAYLSFEWLKLSKRWMPRIILALLLGLTLVGFWGQASRISGRPDMLLPRGWLAALSFCSFFAPFFWPVLGGSWAGNEYGWGTIRTILSRRPQRLTHVLTALAVLLAGLAIALVVILVAGTVAGIAIALLTNNPTFTASVWNSDFLGILVKGYLTAWYVSGFYVLLAYAAATVFRSPAVGIGIGIGGTFAQLVVGRIFNALGGIWNDIAQHFPFEYTNSMIARVVGPGLLPGSGLTAVAPTAPGAGQSLAAITIYGAIALALTLVVVRTRDVTD